jgi:hypothetical protein
MKSGNFNFLEPSGPLQAYNGTVLSLPLLVLLYDTYSGDVNSSGATDLLVTTPVTNECFMTYNSIANSVKTIKQPYKH